MTTFVVRCPALRVILSVNKNDVIQLGKNNVTWWQDGQKVNIAEELTFPNVCREIGWLFLM